MPRGNQFEQQQRADFLRSMSWVAAGFVLLLIPGYVFRLHYYTGAAILGVCAAVLVSLPWLARRTSITVAAHLAALTFTFGVAFLSFIRGDLPMGALIFLIVGPVVLGYLVGPRAAFAWAAVGVVLTAIVLWRVETGRAEPIPELTSPEVLAQKNAFEAFAVVGLLVLMTTAALSIDRRRALVEQERLRLLEELSQRSAGARLGRLASGVAHEINNPLAWMTSGLSLLQQKAKSDPDAEVGEVLGEVMDGAQRLAVIVSDLQAVSHRALNPQDAADPVRVLRIVKSLATAEVGRRGVLEVETPSGLPRIRGNEGALAELLLELVLDSTSTDVSLTAEVKAGGVVFVLSPVLAGDFSRAGSVLASWDGTVSVVDGVARLSLPAAQT